MAEGIYERNLKDMVNVISYGEFHNRLVIFVEA